MTEQLQLRLDADEDLDEVDVVHDDRHMDELQRIAETHERACIARYGTRSPYAPIHRRCEHT